MKNLPHQISEYIRNRFVDGYISNIKTVNDTEGNNKYIITVNDDETIHYLNFDSNNRLVYHSSTPMFEDDDHDYYRASMHGLGLHGIDDY